MNKTTKKRTGTYEEVLMELENLLEFKENAFIEEAKNQYRLKNYIQEYLSEYGILEDYLIADNEEEYLIDDILQVFDIYDFADYLATDYDLKQAIEEEALRNWEDFLDIAPLRYFGRCILSKQIEIAVKNDREGLSYRFMENLFEELREEKDFPFTDLADLYFLTSDQIYKAITKEDFYLLEKIIHNLWDILELEDYLLRNISSEIGISDLLLHIDRKLSLESLTINIKDKKIDFYRTEDILYYPEFLNSNDLPDLEAIEEAFIQIISQQLKQDKDFIKKLIKDEDIEYIQYLYLKQKYEKRR